MGKTFRSVIIASTGDFGDKTDKIKNWVEHAGGTFSKDIDPSVTHLVASKKAWKRYHPMGKSAIYIPCIAHFGILFDLLALVLEVTSTSRHCRT
jgi:hypothetical protein